MKKELGKQIIFGGLIIFMIVSGGVALWVATLRIPDMQSFQDKILAGSTKLYDKTGEVLLYDLNKDVKQQVVPYDEISQKIKNATIAIEDEGFYQHKGIQFNSIIRAVFVNLQSLEFSQGGSTITQQVIKNSLLTSDKKISRKIKEWVLALKLERAMTKDEILNLYLNGTSYGGTYYGVEEATLNFFGKSSSDVTLAEAAYIAAIPQAPSRYSPYGNNKDRLEARKNLVLDQMLKNKLITESEYAAAKAEKVTFKPPQRNNIKAAHFVMFVREYLIEKYGEDMVNNGGLQIITTLDYKLQEKAEEIVKANALKNAKEANAKNAALVAVDPTNGQILVMVGSRDYFDETIEGNYNVATANRQPGSSFKPFAYATAFNKGFTPDTVLFDLPTEFNSNCSPQGTPNVATTKCYTPGNYDNQFRGPMSLRNALAQSINIPAIKVLYLAGMRDTLQTAQDMGITSLSTPETYGLTLVLGGGEVSPLEMTSAYATFANNGLRNPHTPIIKVTDKSGKVIEEFKEDSKQVIPEQSSLLITDILRDNNARLPLFSAGSGAMFYDREVALKTGTTNDYKDFWVIGYTPQIAVGAWVGNNNPSDVIKRNSSSRAIVVPLWRQFMDVALTDMDRVSFKRPEPYPADLKPILKGAWQGGQTITIDRTTGELATDQTPPENRETQVIGGGDVHTILHYIDKNNPNGPAPSNPQSDSQYINWETPIRAWAQAQGMNNPVNPNQPNEDGPEIPIVTITHPTNLQTFGADNEIAIQISTQSKYEIEKAEFYVNNQKIKTVRDEPFTTSFKPKDENVSGVITIKVVVTDSEDHEATAETRMTVN